MITCNLMGGLGNQIFQIFATIAYAIKSKNQFKFKSSKELGDGGSSTLRYTYWDSFFYKFKPFLIDEMPNMNIIRETDFTYNDLPITSFTKVNLMIFGYFQSYKYFQENYDIICRMLSIAEQRLDIIGSVVDKHHSMQFLEKSISMHFRLGDYKNLPDYHPIMSAEYYKNALQHIVNHIDYTPNVLYFCEDEDVESVNETIQLLKNEFPTIEFERGTNTFDDWQQMLLMSCCNHNIIANSSFSWWAAYFNANPTKIVCYPSVWFGPKMSDVVVTDLFPDEWVKIN